MAAALTNDEVHAVTDLFPALLPLLQPGVDVGDAAGDGAVPSAFRFLERELRNPLESAPLLNPHLGAFRKPGVVPVRS